MPELALTLTRTIHAIGTSCRRFIWRQVRWRAIAWLVWIAVPTLLAPPSFSAETVRRQFLLDPAEGGPFDVRAYYSAAKASQLPVRTLWTQISDTIWVEQDGAMEQRSYKVSESDVAVGGARGVAVKIVEVRPTALASSETFLPYPDSADHPVRQRYRGLDGTVSEWSVVGKADWCVPGSTDEDAAMRREGVFGAAVDVAGVREWRSADGKRSFMGRLSGGSPDHFEVLRANGPMVKLRLGDVSPENRIAVLRWFEDRPWPVQYPKTVSVPMSAGLGLSVVAKQLGADETSGHGLPFSYRTAHFDFGSSVELGREHLQTIGVSFEATRLLMGKLPWGIPLPSNGRSPVRLFETFGEYHEAGGPQHSAGVYMTKTKEFMVPFESIGLVQESGRSYKARERVVFDTLHHELAHQQMDAALPFLPMWMAEGSGEYIGNLPYSKGIFVIEASPLHLKRYFAPTPMMKQLTTPRRPAPTIDVKYLDFKSALSPPFWGSDPSRLSLCYKSSFLLFYYFVHLDPDPSRLARYFAFTRRLSLETQQAEERADAYQRRWIDPHNRKVLENAQRVTAYNRRIDAYNAAIRRLERPAPLPEPIWAVIAAPPPTFRLAGDVAAMTENAESFGLDALTWTIPTAGPSVAANRSGQGPVAGGAPALPAGFGIEEIRLPPAIEIGVRNEVSLDNPLNQTAQAKLMTAAQTRIFGTTEEIAARVTRAFEEHGFPLPPAMP